MVEDGNTSVPNIHKDKHSVSDLSELRKGVQAFKRSSPTVAYRLKQVDTDYYIDRFKEELVQSKTTRLFTSTALIDALSQVRDEIRRSQLSVKRTQVQRLLEFVEEEYRNIKHDPAWASEPTSCKEQLPDKYSNLTFRIKVLEPSRLTTMLGPPVRVAISLFMLSVLLWPISWILTGDLILPTRALSRFIWGCFAHSVSFVKDVLSCALTKRCEGEIASTMARADTDLWVEARLETTWVIVKDAANQVSLVLTAANGVPVEQVRIDDYRTLFLHVFNLSSLGAGTAVSA